MDRKTTEFKKLEEFLKKNEIEYSIYSGIIRVYTNKKNMTLVYREHYDTWMVIENTPRGTNSYTQYTDIIIGDLKKLKSA